MKWGIYRVSIMSCCTVLYYEKDEILVLMLKKHGLLRLQPHNFPLEYEICAFFLLDVTSLFCTQTQTSHMLAVLTK